jgi:polyisoprenoid-binding protein YceI
VYSVDGAKSKVEMHVYREGLFKFLGHDHVVAAKSISGEVDLDPDEIVRSSVRLNVEAKSLTVLDPGVDAKERRDVQETMESDKVLDVKRFAKITFVSTAVSQAKKVQNGYELILAGKLSLHGVEKGISFPLRVQLRGNQIEALGETLLLQTDYGIKPVRVGGGTVKVKDKLKITFGIIASKQGASVARNSRRDIVHSAVRKVGRARSAGVALDRGRSQRPAPQSTSAPRRAALQA